LFEATVQNAENNLQKRTKDGLKIQSNFKSMSNVISQWNYSNYSGSHLM